MFQDSFKDVSKKLSKFHECLKEVSWVFQGSFKGVSMKFHRSFKGDSVKFQGSFKRI